MFIREETQDLIKDIVRSSDWVQGEYCLVNENTHSKIWTSNGTLFFDFYPNAEQLEELLKNLQEVE